VQRAIAVVFGASAFLASLALGVEVQEKPSPFEPVEVTVTEEAAYPVNAICPGTVVLEVAVSSTGEVEEVKVVKDAPPFTQEALRAIKKWKFRPAKFEGEPIRSRVPVAFSFSRPAVWWSTSPR
jgi:TonB family protein